MLPQPFGGTLLPKRKEAEMSETTKLMSFQEFRASAGELFEQAVRQQREFFRDAAAADEVLRPGVISLGTWVQWDRGDALIPVAG